ncbi:hypothetical protein NQ317_010577 [Molorchus minor]|uniref:Uncharacterized protein n=1 Tax=Molorchus minor TaxID=1323400 RepID=A0ABQ9IU67_9CUCU|nr:hypothetical protein NQ317_010577 [Molorchus minor]
MVKGTRRERAASEPHRCHEPPDRASHEIEDFANGLRNQVRTNADTVETHTLATLLEAYKNARRIVSLTNVFRRNAILTDCRNHHIPAAVLQPATLTRDLTKLDKVLRHSGQGLAIPLESVSRYYQLPISDCAMTKDTLTVHVRVPIKSRGNRIGNCTSS